MSEIETENIDLEQAEFENLNSESGSLKTDKKHAYPVAVQYQFFDGFPL